MTEKSYFHDGTALGDAQYAPYSNATFADLIRKIYTGQGAWVLPNQSNNLDVAPGVGRQVTVDTGRAIIEGYWYENDASVNVNLTANTSSYTRVDAVAVEVDTEAGTASIVVFQGSPNVKGTLPVVEQCDTKVYLLLAYIMLPSGYASVQSKYILDQRRFLNNAYHKNNYSTQNEFPNGLFLGWQDSENSGASRSPLPGWYTTGGTTQAIKDAERFDTMIYGRCAHIYEAPSPTTDGIETGVQTYENSTDMATFSMTLLVNSGEIEISFGSTTKVFPASHDPYTVIIRGNVTGLQMVKIVGSSDDAIFGDLRLALGYCIADQETDYPQIIHFNRPVFPNRDYSNHLAPTLTGLSTGKTQLYFENFGHTEDIYSVFNTRIRGLILSITISGTDTAASNTYASIIPGHSSLGTPVMHVYAKGAPNGEKRSRIGIIGEQSILSGSFYLDVNSGTGTLDVELAIVGVIL